MDEHGHTFGSSLNQDGFITLIIRHIGRGFILFYLNLRGIVFSIVGYQAIHFGKNKKKYLPVNRAGLFRVNSRLKHIIALMKKNENIPALELLDQLIDAPDYDEKQWLEPLYHRAWLLMCMGHYERAVSDYERILAVSPADTTCRAYLAQCLFRGGKLEEARDTALVALQQDRRNMLALQLISDYYHITTGKHYPHEKKEIFPHEENDNGFFQNKVIRFLETIPPTASIHPSIGHFIYWLVRYLRPGVAIETGSYIGYSSLCIAHGLKDNNRGHLHAYDLFEKEIDLPSPFIEVKSNILTTVRQHARRAGLEEWVTYHKGDSSTLLKDYFDEHPEPKIDFAFIDGDHSIKGCLKDWIVTEQHLSDKGIVLIHDINPSISNWYGPRYLIERLRVKDPEGFDIIKLPTPDNTGLALIKRNDSKLTRWKPGMWELLRDLLLIHVKWSKR